MIHSPFPEIRTPRFLLRRIVPDDLPTVFAGLSDPRVIANYGVSYGSLDETRSQMEWFDSLLEQGTGIWWGICEPTRREIMLGACGLNNLVQKHRQADLGYWLLPANWGNGVARECMSSMIAYAFGSLGLHRIGAEVDLDNHRSVRLLEKLGFCLEGIRRDCELKEGEFLSLKMYSRLATDAVRDSCSVVGR